MRKQSQVAVIINYPRQVLLHVTKNTCNIPLKRSQVTLWCTCRMMEASTQYMYII